MKCAKCNGPAKDWKCAIDGAEASQHDPQHVHGVPPSDRQCMPKCEACSQAESLCTCAKVI